MRIGIDGRLWNETGVGRYIRNLVTYLAEIDTKNHYILFVRNKNDKKGKISWNALPKENWKIVEADIQWHSISEQFQFVQLLNKENLDLMHFPYFSLPVLYRKPFVVTIHDLIIHHFPTGKASTLPPPLYHAKRIGYKAVVRSAINRAKKIIVPLQAVKNDVLQEYKVPKEKIVVTYEGFDSLLHQGKNLLAEEKIGTENPYFLYVGNAYPHKNLDELITAFLAFKKNVHENVQLFLVGKDDFFYKKLKQTVLQQKRGDIHFLHDVSDQELSFLYKNALALLSASKMEGFGLTPLEAISVGGIALVSDIPSFREVCGEAALYFDISNQEDMKRKMEEVVTFSRQQRENLITIGENRLKLFSWKRMAEQTLHIYESSISLR